SNLKESAPQPQRKMCEYDSRLRGEAEAAAQRRLRVRGTLHALGLAESPPHPDRIWRCDLTSPRKRGEVKRPYSASSRITLIKSDLPSKPMPGSSGITMWPSCTRTESGKPP